MATNLVGAAIGVRLGLNAINGMLKPNYTNRKKAYIAIALLALFGILLLVVSVIMFRQGAGARSLVVLAGSICFFYLITFAPYVMNAENYDISVDVDRDENGGVVALTGLSVKYKGRPVRVDFTTGSDGLFLYADTDARKCISYLDGERMPYFQKSRIANFIPYYLAQYGLTSCEIRSHFV